MRDEQNVEVRFSRPIPGVSAAWVKKIILGTLAFEKNKNRRVGAYLTDDAKIHQINKRYLKHDTATDVIAFWFEGTLLTEKERNFLGDIVASVETAKRVAKEMKITFKEELARYLVHGTLHLLGYDDKKPKNKKVMRCRQERIVKRLCTAAER